MSIALRAAVFSLLLVPAPSEAQAWKATRAWISGTDRGVWVLGADDGADARMPVVNFWFGDAGAEDQAPRLVSALPPIAGNPAFVAADAGGLRVLFGDQTQSDYFPDRPMSAGPAWIQECGRPPVAWCGDATEARTWALVATDALRPPQETTTDRADDPEIGVKVDDASASLEAAPESPPESSSAPSRYALLRLEGGVWSRQAAPVMLDEGETFWLAARGGRLHVFWPRGGGIVCATMDNGKWSEAQAVAPSLSPRVAWAAAAKGRVVFLAGVGDEDSDVEGGVHVRVFVRDADGKWRDAGRLRENDEYLLLDPARSAAAVAMGEIVVARTGGAGGLEFGRSDVEGRSPVRFERLSEVRPATENPTGWRESASLAAALLVLSLVMWTRRQQLTTPVALPPGLIPSASWRRLLATFLDFAPAILLVTPFALRIAPELSQSVDLVSLRERQDDPALQAKLAPVQYLALLIYGAWCFTWEMLISTTPGKYLFGCRVLSTAGGKPGARQVFVRNLVRVFMVGIGPPGWIITLMMMVMLSRNRQRVGDLLADTIVVEEGTTPEEPAPPPDSDDGMG